MVDRAHASGLRVSAHVETAADFRLAVRSGVDIVAHMPAAWQVGPRLGFADSTSLEPWLLTDADAALASARGTWVITTLGKAAADPQLASYATIYRHNLRLLESRGVRIALGSDGAEEGIPGEIRFIASLGAVDNAAILRAAARTARLIYPTRALGQLGDGADASFLVLDGDPVADIRAIDRIALRVKDGRALP